MSSIGSGSSSGRGRGRRTPKKNQEWNGPGGFRSAATTPGATEGNQEWNGPGGFRSAATTPGATEGNQGSQTPGFHVSGSPRRMGGPPPPPATPEERSVAATRNLAHALSPQEKQEEEISTVEFVEQEEISTVEIVEEKTDQKKKEEKKGWPKELNRNEKEKIAVEIRKLTPEQKEKRAAKILKKRWRLKDSLDKYYTHEEIILLEEYGALETLIRRKNEIEKQMEEAKDVLKAFREDRAEVEGSWTPFLFNPEHYKRFKEETEREKHRMDALRDEAKKELEEKEKRERESGKEEWGRKIQR